MFRNPDIREIIYKFPTKQQVDDRISILETKIDLIDRKLDTLIIKLDS